MAYVLGDRRMQQNLRGLFRYLAFLTGVIVIYTVGFHWIMWTIEGERHSWLTGFYWTLTVMSTLGFGDITFQSDIGRLFSVVVLLSGIVLLLIVLPFAFISLFYAPWLEARLRTRAPRELPEGMSGHVLVCGYDAVAAALGRKLDLRGVPWFVVEPDPGRVMELYSEDIPVMSGTLTSAATVRAARAERARLVLANRDDRIDTNIALSVREVSTEVPIFAIAEDPDAVHILELTGCDHVLDLKRQLGEHLAARVAAGSTRVHVVGSFRDRRIAEFTVHGTPLAGRTIRSTRLRELTGLNIVGVWRRGRLEAARPDTVLTDYCVPVLVGTEDQLTDLESLLVIHQVNFNPVVIIGGGRVGRAAARALKRREIPVHVVERDHDLEPALLELCDLLVIGDAADKAILSQAGIESAPSVVITTNDDATNIYLAVYCRRTNPDLSIVSRITEERNVEAVSRAGADFVLSYATLGTQTIFALMDDRGVVIVGEGADLYQIQVPPSLSGRTLAASRIGSLTGLNVLAVERADETLTNPDPDTQFREADVLIAIGALEQRKRFAEVFEG
jgi:Trk K+ transport system NAD-binding subunit